MARPRSERPTITRVFTSLGMMLAASLALGVVVAGLAVPFVGVAGIATQTAAESMDDLPTELEDVPLAQKTTMLDSRGNVIATLYDENRVNVELDDIKRTMVKAIVAIEDYRFYQHGALDVRGTVRALVTNSASSSVQQGGSSLTQQLVKLSLLNAADTKAEQRAATEQTYARKLRELRYAVALEQKHSKDWILERYLNTAYFGDGAYGIQAAAKHFFDVNASELDLRQSATLAGLVQNPSTYDPTNAPERALERRNVVLDRMAELGVVKDRAARRTKKTDLGLDVQDAKNGCLYSAAPFFCDYATSYLLADPALGETRAERQRLIEAGGLTITTTVDLRFQQAATDSVQSQVNPTDQAIGGLAMVEPRTGAVKAIAQSRPMGNGPGQTFLNYVTPQEYGDSAGFQPGSTFKPFVLATAIKQGIPLSTSIASPQTRTFNQADFANCPGQPPFAGTFPVNNSTGAGTFNLYTGTQQSVNTFFVELERRTGVCEPYNLAKQLGIRLDNPTGVGAERVPIFTLGVADVSPVEMAEAYATFAGRGLHCDARPVSSIEDANGNVVKTYDPTCEQVLDAPVADAVNDVLRGVQEPGGFGFDAGISLSQESAGKTGTTSSQRAVWFSGYTPNLAAAAMVAGANQAGQPQSLVGQTVGGSFVDTASGSGTAGPLWGDAMQVVQQWLPDATFTQPSGTDIAGVQVTIPDVGGQDPAAAEAQLETLGFVVTQGGSVYSDFSVGTVAYTSPAGGTALGSGGSLTLYTSAGPAPAPPPAPSGGTGGDTGGGSPGNGGGTPPGGGNPGGQGNQGNGGEGRG